MRKQTQFFQPEQTRMNRAPRRRGPGGPLGGPGMMPGEKPKDFKKSIGIAAALHGALSFRDLCGDDFRCLLDGIQCRRPQNSG